MEDRLRQMRLFLIRKMRREDSKELLIEGRIDFNPVKSKINFLIFLILFSCKSFPQVPINGFCKYQVFSIDSGYQKFIPLNYNDDSYTDLLFFNSAINNVFLLNGDKNGTFGIQHRYKIPEDISDIQYIWSKSNKIDSYAFISRKQSSAGIIKFNTEGYPEILSGIKFNTYPENLSTGDVNGDGVPELLVSGGAFNGLSLVYQEQKLREKKIISKTSYSEAIFADLNNDGYPDIAAFEMFSNKLQFFYNNSRGNFNKVREISFDNPVTSLQTTDINLDSYTDLIFTEKNTIRIFYGDFTSAYEDTVSIHTKYNVDKLITGDFNRDGKIDIAYISKSDGIISLIFAKDNRKFYPELIYFKKDSFEDITPYYSKFVNGIGIINNGNLYLISNLGSVSDEVNIVSGAYPAAVSYFDRDNNSINDICFIDGYNKTLNLLTRSNSGIPESWFSIPLFESENALIVNNKLPGEKTFFCFTREKKLIEIVRVDFRKNSYKRMTLYSPGKIKDIKYKESTERLYVAFTKDKNLGVTVFTNERGQFADYTISGIRKDVSDAALSVYENPEVFYAAGTDTLIIGERILEGNQVNSEFQTNLGYSYNINLIAGNFISKVNPALFGFLSEHDKNDLIFFLSPDAFTVIGRNDQTANLRIKDKNQLFFGELRFNSPGRVCYFNQEQHNIKYLELKDGNKIISRNLLLENINARSFFIKNMNTREFHVVYIDNNKNCITIRELK